MSMVQDSLFMEPTFLSEVLNGLARLKAGKSCGLANIPSFLLETAAVVIAPTLSFFIYHSFELGLFPDSMKEAKVIPVFKMEISYWCLIITLSQSCVVFQKYLKKLFTKDFFLININFCHQINIVLDMDLMPPMPLWM